MWVDCTNKTKETLELDFLFYDKLGKGLWYMKTLHNRTKKKKITYCCPRRTRRARYSRLPRSPLHKIQRKKKRRRLNMCPFFQTLIVTAAGARLPWFQECQVCHLFHRYPEDPGIAGGRCIKGLYLARSLKTSANTQTRGFTHILPLFANGPLWALDASAALQKTNVSASGAIQSSFQR